MYLFPGRPGSRTPHLIKALIAVYIWILNSEGSTLYILLWATLFPFSVSENRFTSSTFVSTSFLKTHFNSYLFWLHWVFPVVRGFSCWGSQTPQSSDPVVMAHGLGCPAARGILVPRPGIEPCIGRQMLNHWTAREAHLDWAASRRPWRSSTPIPGTPINISCATQEHLLLLWPWNPADEALQLRPLPAWPVPQTSAVL